MSAVVDRARIRRATLAAREFLLQGKPVPAEVARAVEVVARIEARKPAAEIERDAAQAVEALRAEIESEALAWRDFYADLLREALQQLIDDELRWRLKAILDEQDEEQAILLMLMEM